MTKKVSTKRCGLDTGSQDATSDVYPCWVDQQPCEVITQLRTTLPLATIEQASRSLPCSYCRNMMQNAEQLPRLGRHRRRVLLQAAAPDDAEGNLISPPSDSHADDVATRRAILDLYHAGLLWIGWKMVRNKEATGHWYGRDYYHRSVWLSPLGDAVVKLLRGHLVSAQPIRWEKVRAQLIARCRELPAQLLARFVKGVRGQRDREQALVECERMGLQFPEANRELIIKCLKERIDRKEVLQTILDAAGYEEPGSEDQSAKPTS